MTEEQMDEMRARRDFMLFLATLPGLEELDLKQEEKE